MCSRKFTCAVGYKARGHLEQVIAGTQTQMLALSQEMWRLLGYREVSADSRAGRLRAMRSVK